jgi:hypothetical protein
VFPHFAAATHAIDRHVTSSVSARPSHANAIVPTYELRIGRRQMKSDLTIVFNYIISQWSFTPDAFKSAIINAALAKFVLSLFWWLTRFLVARFPRSTSLSLLNRMLDTRPAKLVILVLDVTLIDVFLFFAVVALMDLHVSFSYFSLWTAALFSFLLVYMLMLTHRDVRNY